MKLVYLVSLFVLVLQHFEGTETTGCTPKQISFPCITYKTVSTAKQRKTECGRGFWLWEPKIKYCTKYSKKFITGVNHRTCYKIINHGCWGSWSSWSTWGQCGNHKHHKCIGQQQMTRTRVCDSPKPSNGGRYCPGSSNMYITRCCQIGVNGGWSVWGHWKPLSPCSNSCGKGWNLMIRERSCTNPTPRCGGQICHGPSIKHKMVSCNSEKLCGRRGK